MAYIYKILNKINGKFYIGSANDYKKRWYQHKSALKTNSHDNNYLQNAWNKYGEENFEWIILERNIDEDIKYNVEQKYLDKLNPFPPFGYNIAKIANGSFIGKDGNVISGEDINTSTHTNEQITCAKRYMSEGLKYKEITKLTDVEGKTLSHIKSGRIWLNVGSEYNDKIKELYNKPKITKEVAEELYISGMSEKEIADIFDITDKRVKQLLEFYKAKINGNTFICTCCGIECIKSKWKNKYGKIQYINNQKYCKSCAKRVDYKKRNERRKKNIA